MIVQSFGRDGQANLSFTVPQARLRTQRSTPAADDWPRGSAAAPVSSRRKVAKLSVSGIGMRSHTGVAIRMFQSLAEAGINVEMINTSEVRVNVVVDGRQGKPALAALQQAFADAQR